VDICSGLRDKGFDVRLAYSSKGGRLQLKPSFLFDKINHSKIPCYDVPEMRHEPTPFLDLLSLWQLYCLFRKIRPYIVHTHMSKAGILGRFAAALAKVPHIFHSVRGWSFYPYQHRPIVRKCFISMERLAASCSQKLLSVSDQQIEDGLKEGIGIDQDYIKVRSGIKLTGFAKDESAVDTLYRELKIPIGTTIVGGVLGLEKSKAPFDFLAVAERVNRDFPEVHFLLVGDGSLRESLLTAIKKKNLSHRFQVLGFRDDVPSLLNIMNVFLLTSHWEGLPRVLIEALSTKIPIVATAVGGIPTIINHGINGFLAPPGDIDCLTQLVISLLTNRTSAQEIGMATPGKILQEFSLPYVIQKYQDIYEPLIHYYP
jgi:glycosyltransferase involved in cell wall biosynthesis